MTGILASTHRVSTILLSFTPAVVSLRTGKFMRHVKLTPGTAINAAELSRLIHAAYLDIKARVENG